MDVVQLTAYGAGLRSGSLCLPCAASQVANLLKPQICKHVFCGVHAAWSCMVTRSVPALLVISCRLDMPLTSWGSRVHDARSSSQPCRPCHTIALAVRVLPGAASLTVLPPTGSYWLVRAPAGYRQALSRSACIHRTFRGAMRWRVVKPRVFRTMRCLRQCGTCVPSRPSIAHAFAGRVLRVGASPSPLPRNDVAFHPRCWPDFMCCRCATARY